MFDAGQEHRFGGITIGFIWRPGQLAVPCLTVLFGKAWRRVMWRIAGWCWKILDCHNVHVKLRNGLFEILTRECYRYPLGYRLCRFELRNLFLFVQSSRGNMFVILCLLGPFLDQKHYEIYFLFISFPFHSAFPGLLSFVCERMTSFGSRMMWTPTCRVLSLSYLKGGIYVIWVGMAKVYFTWLWEKSQLQSQSKWKTCILAFNQGVCLSVFTCCFYILCGDMYCPFCREISFCASRYTCIFA